MRLDRATRWLVAILVVVTVGHFALRWSAGPNTVSMDALEPADCWFDVPADQSARCGYLLVPDHRDRAVTTYSRLAVAVFSPKGGPTRPDPVLFLSGGPGGAFGFTEGKGWWWSWVDTVALSHGREFIAMDQRGVGLSIPRVDCPGLRVLEKKLLEQEVRPEDEDKGWLEAIAMCRERLLREGYDLSIFGSAESARDVEALRLALGVERWNLYGISYGTRLALTVARDIPEGIRSLVLDSVYPVEAQTMVEGPKGLDFALRMMWMPCAADEACAAEHRDMYEKLESVIVRLNQSPIRVRFTHPDTLEPHEVVLDGDRLLDTLVVGLSGHIDLDALTAAISGLDRGDPRAGVTLVKDHWVAMQDEDFSYPVNFSVECREEVPFNDTDTVRRAARVYPALTRHELRDAELMRKVCEMWGEAPIDPHNREPVRTSIPTLLLAGIFDPVTPAVWAERTLPYLENGHLLKFIAGHSVTDADPCALQLIAAFIDDPSKAPEAGCYPRQGGAEFQPPQISRQ